MTEKTYEQGLEDGVEEGIAIAKTEILGLIDDYINNPDIDIDMLIEFIRDVE
jgi:hypothetical protein